MKKKFYPFIVAAIMFSATSNAQIFYTDIAPDSTYTINTGWGKDTFNLDLNGDNTTDFMINAARLRGHYMESPIPSYVSITPQANNAFITTPLNTVKKLVAGDVISSSQTWQNTTTEYLKQQVYIYFNPPTNIGEWDSVVDGYIGLQLITGGQTYYGWVRMDVTVSTSSASMTIKDYAYNNIPNHPILAGQTNTTAIIEDSFASSINLSPNPFTNQLTLNTGVNEQTTISLYNFLGQQVLQQTFTTATTLNTAQLAYGIYFYELRNSKGTLKTGKVVKQ